ncbi:hypothetical protein Hdeb2414_s0014g00424111 [Helianthus debilis subsp. tardiflorus]
MIRACSLHLLTQIIRIVISYLGFNLTRFHKMNVFQVTCDAYTPVSQSRLPRGVLLPRSSAIRKLKRRFYAVGILSWALL